MIKRENVGLAFAQRTGSTTRGTRFVLRLAVLVLVLAVRTPSFCLRSNLLSRGTGLQASSRRRSSALGGYYTTQTK